MDRALIQPEGTQYEAGHFFALNLRTHLMRHLAVADQQECDNEHDMRALKALSIPEIRMGVPRA